MEKMSKEIRAQKEQRLDQVALEWKAAQGKENEAVVYSKWAELMVLGFELYDQTYGDGTEKILDDLERYFMKNYNPEKGSPSHYLNMAFSRRKLDKKAIDRNTVSMDDAPDSDDDVESSTVQKVEAQIMRENPNPPESQIVSDDVNLELLIIMLALPSKLHGRANNEQRIQYFRMFFTDYFADTCHTVEAPQDWVRHERDAFKAMQLGFLDFFMAKVCRTIPELCACDVKLHGEMVEGCPMEEPGHPLPNNVYKTYLNSCEGYNIKSDGTISNQRDAYKKFLREHLC